MPGNDHLIPFFEPALYGRIHTVIGLESDGYNLFDIPGTKVQIEPRGFMESAVNFLIEDLFPAHRSNAVPDLKGGIALRETRTRSVIVSYIDHFDAASAGFPDQSLQVLRKLNIVVQSLVRYSLLNIDNK